MRRLVMVAFVLPLLAGCGWSPYSVSSSPVIHPPVHRVCVVMSPGGESHHCRSSARRGTAIPMTGFGTLTDNKNDSYVAWGFSSVSPTESTVEIPVAPGGTLTDLQVHVSTAPGTGANWAFTVDKNGTPTYLTCSIAGTGTSCNDASQVAVVAGDKIDLDVTPVSAPALTMVTWSVELLPSR